MEGDNGETQTILPLRISLAGFTPNKSQLRTLRRNHDVVVSIAPTVVDEERAVLFLKHRERFTTNVPESLRDFISSPVPDRLPCMCFNVEVRLAGRLVAVSYLDVDVE